LPVYLSPGGTPIKIARPASQKPLALPITKICDFSQPIYDQIELDRCDWHSSHMIYEGLLLYDPSDDDKKVTSKNIYITKIHTLLRPKWLKNPTL